MCMDYSSVPQHTVPDLYKNFDALAQFLAFKIIQLAGEGFDIEQSVLVGFSFGGRLVPEAAAIVKDHFAAQNKIMGTIHGNRV